MCFFDLNIPYQESDRKVVEKSSLMSRRLKLVIKAMELGYTGVAYNRTFKGIMSESDRCSIAIFPISNITPSSAFFATVKFHRELLNVAVSCPFRQYTRLTVVVDTPSQALAVNSENPILKSYDIVAVRPMNQSVFDQACQTLKVDMISIDFSEKLPFRLKQPMIKAAMKRGVFFEISYSGMLADAQSRRTLVSNCKLLVDWTRGRNLIFSSAATAIPELRGPLDVANLFSVIGLSTERAQAAVSKNCRYLLANALRKKHFYKEAVRVEKIPVHLQSCQDKTLFESWLKWDPISSDEGDLLLDDLEKYFVACNNSETLVEAMQSNLCMNDLPANGLRIEGDVLSAVRGSPDSQAISNSPITPVDINHVVEISEKHVENSQSPCQQNHMPENEGGISTMTAMQEEVFHSVDDIAPVFYEIEATSTQKRVAQWGDYLNREEIGLPLNQGSGNLIVDGGGVHGMPEDGVSVAEVPEIFSVGCQVGDAMTCDQASTVEDSALLSSDKNILIPCEKLSVSSRWEPSIAVHKTEEQVPNLASRDLCDSTEFAKPAEFQVPNPESQLEIGECQLEGLTEPHEVTIEKARERGLSSSSPPCSRNLSVEKVDETTRSSDPNDALSMRPLSAPSVEEKPVFGVMLGDPQTDSMTAHERLVKCRYGVASGNEKPLSGFVIGDPRTDLSKCHSGRGKRKRCPRSAPILFPFKRFWRSASSLNKKSRK